MELPAAIEEGLIDSEITLHAVGKAAEYTAT